MPKTFRNALILLLALLQLLAPLVHAHTATSQAVAPGVHLPGLENLAKPPAQQPDAVHSAWAAEQADVLVGVSCGIRHGKSCADLPAIFFPPPGVPTPGVVRDAKLVAFSPQAPSCRYCHPALRPISPRAPPSHI